MIFSIIFQCLLFPSHCKFAVVVSVQSKVCTPIQDNELIDAYDHIIKSTFDPHTCQFVKASCHTTISHQDWVVKKARDNMTKHNLKMIGNNEKAVCSGELKGVFLCSNVNSHGHRCMCAFSTLGGRERHMKLGHHKFPILDLKSWVHQLHLSGNFAFSLATGTRTNRSSAINKERKFVVKEGSNPVEHKFVDTSWFANGCYVKYRKSPFNASESLKIDLENLFQEGFISDGPKQGKNKYTGMTALTYLKNL